MGAGESVCKLHAAHVPLTAGAANSAAAVLLAQYGTGALISVEGGTRNTVSGTITFDSTNPTAPFDVAYSIRKLLPCATVTTSRRCVTFSCKMAPAADDA